MTASPNTHYITHPNNRLMSRRESLGLSITEVSARCGVCTTTYWRAENGCEPKLSTALAIARVLGRTVAQLWPSK